MAVGTCGREQQEGTHTHICDQAARPSLICILESLFCWHDLIHIHKPDDKLSPTPHLQTHTDTDSLSSLSPFLSLSLDLQILSSTLITLTLVAAHSFSDALSIFARCILSSTIRALIQHNTVPLRATPI